VLCTSFGETSALTTLRIGGDKALVPDQNTEPPLPEGFLLSVVVPVYNEVGTLAQLLERIRNSGVPCEIILVDDGSTDGTRELLEGWHDQEDLQICLHGKNQGKGAALRTGFAAATGDIVLIQDGDLEYNPADYRRLIDPILRDKADVVYGSRFQGGRSHLYCWFYAGNRLLTMVSNVVNGLSLTDMETCYKVFRREVLSKLSPQLQENRFGIEPEITARLAQMKDVRLCEVPISYQSRSFAEGKKIRLRDGLRALWCIFWYRVGR